MGINIVDERIGFYGEFLNNIKNNNIKEPDYDLVDQLVEKYQAGDQDAAEELINQLSPYMIKFFKIIRLGVIDLNDRDSRRFISLFIDDYGARDKLKKKFQSRDARNEAYQAALMVQSMCSQIPAEDIVQELIVILLTLAKRFIKHRKKVNFCGYLYNGFRFELARRIKIITVDPLTHRTDFNVSFDDGEYISDEDLIDENELAFCNEPIMELEEDLGNSWIRGITCGDMFEDLTPMQRMILKLYYIDGENDSSIGDKLGIHRTTVKSQRVKAEENLKTKGDPYAKEKES
jgi:RNA polymerase sigma factor (sigma-70 family)